MAKNRFGIFFVLSAAFLLMLHAFIPHHHHSVTVCFAISHHAGENHHSHEADPCKENQNHEEQKCVLEQGILLPVNNIKLKEKALNLTRFIPETIKILTGITPDATFNITTKDFEYYRKKPPVFFRSIFTGPINTLRAPPLA